MEYPNADGQAEVNLSTRNLPLDVLYKAGTGQANSPVEGTVDSAHWRVTASGIGVDKVELASDYHLTGLRAAGLTVDAVDARASYQNGQAVLGPVTATTSATVGPPGRTDLSVTYNLATPTRVHTHVTVHEWPYALGAALGGITEARANADVDMGYDFRLKGAAGTVTASADVNLYPSLAGHTAAAAKQTLAHAQLAVAVRGRTIDLDELSGRVLNGTFTGQGQVDVGKPLEAVGQVKWEKVDAGALYTITGNPALKDLGGIFSGAVTIAPTREPRPLEPIRLDLYVRSQGGHFRTVQLGTPSRLIFAHGVGYLGLETGEGPGLAGRTGVRAVLASSDVFLGDGVVHIWGRESTLLDTQSAIVEYRGLSLDQLVHVFPKQATGLVPGTLTGELRLIRNGSGLAGLTGGGPARIAEADLINIKAIGPLYQKLGHGGGGLQADGSGGLNLGLEAGTVRIDSLRFFNRGIQASGLLRAGPIDLSDIDDAPLAGQVVGSLRDLKGSRLPFLSDFDKDFSVLQGNLTTFNVGGTLGQPAITSAGVDAIGSDLRELLVGDAQKNAAQSSP